MVKSYVITIDEVDEPKDAVALLRESLSKLPAFDKNALGIISAHADAFYSGVYDAICNEFPFPLIGISCDSHGANDLIGGSMISVTVLTGTDFEAVGGYIDASCIEEDFFAISAKSTKSPKLALLYTPFAEKRFPSKYIDVISVANPTLPIFGGVAKGKSTYERADGTPQDGNLVFWNGKASADSAAVVLICGDFAPKFFVSTLNSKDFLANDVGVVTKAEENRLCEINCINAPEFLGKFGFDKKIKSNYANADAGLLATTFVLDCGMYCDINCKENCRAAKQIISRSPIEFTDDSVICAGKIVEGAQVSITVSTPESVIESAKEMIEAIKASGAETALMYSCVGRQVGLYAKPLEEIETLQAEFKDKLDYSVAYVGGEICPTCVISESVNNHEHNQTLIACVF